MGRHPKKYDESQATQVQAMAQYGVPIKDIAASIGMDDKTLSKLYGKEFKEGKAIANSKVGKRLFQKCMEGDTTALIFWAKCRMGWHAEDKKIEKTANEENAKQLADAFRDAMRSVGQ